MSSAAVRTPRLDGPCPHFRIRPGSRLRPWLERITFAMRSFSLAASGFAALQTNPRTYVFNETPSVKGRYYVIHRIDMN